MDFSKDISAGYLVNQLARIFERGLSGRIRPLGLTTGAFPALLELWAEDGLTQKQLVDRLDIEQATMANTLNRMERDGLVRREKDAKDRRVQRVRLTEKARALQDAAVAQAIAENAERLAPLTEEEQAQFIHLLRRLIAGPAAETD
ncbi:MarR family winged helix-turn-helix transcriptional regulator [Chachezhania sediminis]|uniref:MarR family winged helix-turn-helix transcriptional regulator n=1 Tax=Chachezhania sediminis TaxID=2599291 RepID=UPI00131B58DF|nr:MarR family transcriptional regulator [Chachezhania sediminis]